jgi:hypothetical protein
MTPHIDRGRTFREYDYPREPGLYTPTRHFIHRAKEPERFLTGEVIERCITDGELRDNGDGCACFRKGWGRGVAYYIIAGFHEMGHRVLVTGWPHFHDRQLALASGRWASSELDDIQSLNERYQDRFEDKYPVYDKWLKQQHATET